MNKQQAKVLGPKVIEILNAAFAEEGIVVSRAGGGTFDAHSLTFKIELREEMVHESGVPLTREAQDFLDYTEYSADLHPEDLGRTVTLSRTSQRIVGYRPRARKFKILCESTETGERLCYRAQDVGLALAKEYAAYDERLALYSDSKGGA